MNIYGTNDWTEMRLGASSGWPLGEPPILHPHLHPSSSSPPPAPTIAAQLPLQGSLRLAALPSPGADSSAVAMETGQQSSQCPPASQRGQSQGGSQLCTERTRPARAAPGLRAAWAVLGLASVMVYVVASTPSLGEPEQEIMKFASMEKEPGEVALHVLHVLSLILVVLCCAQSLSCV